MAQIKRRRERLEKFLDFIIKNKEKYGFTQICALFGLVTGISIITINTYSKQLIDSGAVKLKDDRVVEVIDIFKTQELES